MNQSYSSGSGSNATSKGIGFGQTKNEVLCECGKVAIVMQGWMDSNPGRRFYRCGDSWKSVCNFFSWYDVEKPYGWQKNALIEARNVIKKKEDELKKMRELQKGESQVRGTQKDSQVQVTENENKKLKEEIQLRTEMLYSVEEENKALKDEFMAKSEMWEAMVKDNEKMKQEMKISTEKEMILRQCFIISWLGFVGVFAVVVHALK